MRALAGLAAACALAAAALAEAPRVAADVAPVHSLVARVMEGVGEPARILVPGASPHDHAMRRSEAAALREADLVVWMGQALTPWLRHAIGQLADGAEVLPHLEVEGATLLPFREGATFAAEGGADDHDHDHGAINPHAWLDADKAALWLDAIAGALADFDPDGAEAYRANARAGRAEIAAAAEEAEHALAPVRGRPFVVQHDAYRYFEERFGLAAAGAIADGDAAPPSPARLATIRDAVAEGGVACVLSERGGDAGAIAVAIGGTGTSTVVLDPLGADLEPGPALYPEVLRRMAATLAGCLSGGG